ncbi:MAG: sulfate ABC transporter ATP-binding protein [Methylobacteriaceae bacterium]|jgi:sulfate transport system ATP-binding protein|nr:sulfate ABC transporter ATP-binding protein [Methylobacteriaceae bacterium]
MSIQAIHITKTFGDFVAVDDVSLEFPTGKLVSLLGPSGCGKTTLLRIIAGLEQPDSGRIVLEDHDASRVHARDRQVGFVFQHYALFHHMTVYDNVAFGLRMKPRRIRPSEAAIKDRVTSLLELVQLGWVADRFPSQLSGGQRQRIALARALAVEPRVLLLDEPFGALDAKVRKELRRWLRKLHDDLHITSVFVTHDQEEALEVADEVVLMNKGRVEQRGTPDEVYKNPATSFVYNFIGSVNLFRGRVGRNGVTVGEVVLPSRVNGSSAAERGGNVLAFARPHEIRVLPDEQGIGGFPAQIDRIINFGLTAHIELKGIRATEGEFFNVEVLKETIDEQQLHAGKIVRLVPSELRLFEYDSAANEV